MKRVSGKWFLLRAIFSLKGFACGMGIVIIYAILGSIGGFKLKDDDLYLPPEDISDDQNVMAALGEIVGMRRDYDNVDSDMSSNLVNRLERESPNYGGTYSPFIQCYMDNCGEGELRFPLEYCVAIGNDEVICLASNRVEFLAGVDAALSTNECIATAIARAAKRPRYVNQLTAESSCPDALLIRDLCWWLYGARHMRYIELKRYGDAIEDDRTLLELAKKIMDGRSSTIEKMVALAMYSGTVDRLAEIARLDDVDERVLAEVDALLSKYEVEDWRHVCSQMARDAYSHGKNILRKYAASPWSERMKFWQTTIGKKHSTWKYSMLNCIFNHRGALSNHAERCRAELSLLDDYKSLVTYSEKRDDPIMKWTRKLCPEFWDVSWGIPLPRYFVRCADIASCYRAFRLLVVCRRHFIRTGKMPENLKDVSAGLPQETIVDPSLGTPYEIKTWVDGDMAHAAVFRRDASGTIVALHEWHNEDDSMADSRAEGSIAHICWLVDGKSRDGAINANGEVRHYRQNAYDYYTFSTNGVEWAYEIEKNGLVRLGYREKLGKIYLPHGAILGALSGDVVIPTAICGRKVVGIGSDAFAGCRDMTSVTIPESVSTIGTRAFSYCGNLREVIIHGDSSRFEDPESEDCFKGVHASCRIHVDKDPTAWALGVTRLFGLSVTQKD